MSGLLLYIWTFSIGVLLYILYKTVPRFYKIYKIGQTLKPFQIEPHRLLTGHIGVHPGPTEEGLHTNVEWMKRKPLKAWAIYQGPLRPLLSVHHPDTVKQFLKTTEPKPKKDSGGYNFLIPWIGDGLLLSSDKKWYRNRRLLTPGFHFEILKPYINIFNSCGDIFKKNIEAQIKASAEGGSNESIEIFQPISMLTLDIILQCAFSYKEDIQNIGKGNPYINTITSLSNLMLQRAFNPLHYIDAIYYRTANGKSFQYHCDFSHKMARKVISKRRKVLDVDLDTVKSKRYVDFLDILLLARDEEDNVLTDQEIMDEVETFMFEGHDTTASGISWALYNLARHEQYQKHCQQEVDEILGEKEHFEWEDLSKLEYLTRCIKESLRLHPPVHLIMRQLTEPMMVENQWLLKDTLIDINIYNLHHNPHVWGPDVFTYDPDRFLHENVDKRDPYAFVPFSAGPRNCIGQHFAMNEMKCTIGSLLHRFDISVDPNHKAEMVPEVVLKSKNGIKLFFKKRQMKK